MTAVTDRQQLSYVASQVADARVNVELETEGMTLNIGPQHPATHGTSAHHRQARRRAGHRSRPGDGLHAPRLREAHRGPHVPSGDDADQPHRLVGQLRQRGAVHPRRRAADGDRGAAPRAVDPHAAVRAEPHRERHPVPRRHGRAARRAHAGLLRVPRPRVRPQPHRERDGRPVPPELRPHRRPQGRPAQGLQRRVQDRDGQDPGLLRPDGRPARRQPDLPDPHARHRRHPEGRRPRLRPVGCEHPGLGRRLGPPP